MSALIDQKAAREKLKADQERRRLEQERRESQPPETVTAKVAQGLRKLWKDEP